eukprot:TRINITY_DN4587_c0_g1_i6.p2 TRINITY_DN4587_c0_g1~~TRINITY_DN4587_c0_g1_i6.p2  ORF type:complete len:107 (+),score=9.19 TRINITY_DN4587_c0_g1_i6:122-442(+)
MRSVREGSFHRATMSSSEPVHHTHIATRLARTTTTPFLSLHDRERRDRGHRRHSDSDRDGDRCRAGTGWLDSPTSGTMRRRLLWKLLASCWCNSGLPRWKHSGARY